MTPEDLEYVNKSRTADLLMTSLRPFMDKQRGDIISQMKSCYRAGTLTEQKSLSYAASLCVLDDLENQMKQTYLKGQKISKELYDGEARRN